MKTLVLLGGKSERFKEAGYDVPKPCLPGRDGPIIKAVLKGLKPSWLITAGNVRDMDAIGNAVLKCAKTWSAWTPFWTGTDPRGPLYGLTDVAVILEHWPDEELVVSYCDVILEDSIDGALQVWRDLGAESGALTFMSTDPRFGYWDYENFRVVEKQVVSPFAVSGVFYFKSAHAAVAKAQAIAKPGMGIVDLLDERTVMAGNVGNIVDIGTPADYEAYMSQVIA